MNRAGTILLVQDRYVVLTPEKVIVSYNIGSVGARVGAHLLDLIIYGTVMYAFAMVMSAFSIVFYDLGQVVLVLVATFGMFLYFIISEGAFQGQTLGKKALRLRVTNTDGTPLTWRGAILRNLLRPADMLPTLYLVGFIMLFTNPKSQRLGDLIAGTVVLKEPERIQGYTPAPHHVGLHPLEDTVGDLHTMSLEEYHAIKRLTDRFPYLTQQEQRESVETIWKPFAQKEGIQPAPNVHPVYQMEAVVMKFGRMKKLV